MVSDNNSAPNDPLTTVPPTDQPSPDQMSGDARFQPGTSNEPGTYVPDLDENPAMTIPADTAGFRATERPDLDSKEQERLATLQNLGYVDKRVTMPRIPAEPVDRSKLTVAGWADYLAQYHSAHPQRAYTASAAIKSIEVGLAQLAALGHRFGLVEHAAPPPVEFPKMFYRDGSPPIVVHSQEAADALSPGWRDHPSVEGERRPEPLADLDKVRVTEEATPQVYTREFSTEYEDKRPVGNELPSAPTEALNPKGE